MAKIRKHLISDFAYMLPYPCLISVHTNKLNPESTKHTHNFTSNYICNTHNLSTDYTSRTQIWPPRLSRDRDNLSRPTKSYSEAHRLTPDFNKWPQMQHCNLPHFRLHLDPHLSSFQIVPRTHKFNLTLDFAHI
jgi:hypothetical protein